MSSLEYGLDVADTTQAGNCVYAINGLARHVYDRQQCGGGAGAAALAADGQHSAALMHFLRVLLDKLLFKDVGIELIDSTSDLALALILCYEQLFGSMVGEIVASRPAEVHTRSPHHNVISMVAEICCVLQEQERLNAEFGALMTTNGVTRALGASSRAHSIPGMWFVQGFGCDHIRMCNACRSAESGALS